MVPPDGISLFAVTTAAQGCLLKQLPVLTGNLLCGSVSYDLPFFMIMQRVADIKE